MSKLLLVGFAAAALIGGPNFAGAQSVGGAAGAGMSGEAPARGSDAGDATRGGAEDRAAPAVNSAPDKRDEATDTTNTSEQKQPATKQIEPDDKVERDNGNPRAGN
jgi:hypothetical protein